MVVRVCKRKNQWGDRKVGQAEWRLNCTFLRQINLTSQLSNSRDVVLTAECPTFDYEIKEMTPAIYHPDSDKWFMGSACLTEVKSTSQMAAEAVWMGSWTDLEMAACDLSHGLILSGRSLPLSQASQVSVCISCLFKSCLRLSPLCSHKLLLLSELHTASLWEPV